MALDVYVGSLTRYYAGEWDNLAERAARERGDQRRGVRPGVFVDPINSPERIHSTVVAWRAALIQSLGDGVGSPIDWDETMQAPYFTGRPGWDGFGSLVLWAAYAEHPSLRCPSVLPEEWDNDPALMRSNGEGFRSRYSHLVRNVELWLPNAFEFTFEGDNVDGRRVVVGSGATLRRQLSELNNATWKAGSSVTASWEEMVPPADSSLELRARHAFAVLSDLAQKAIDNSLPMKLDY